MNKKEKKEASIRVMKNRVLPLLDLLALATLSTVCVKQSRAEPTGEKVTLRGFSVLCTISRSDCSRYGVFQDKLMQCYKILSDVDDLRILWP